MDFLKKVITSVSSSSGISAEFPYQIDDTASEKSEDFGPSRIWTIQKGHHVLFSGPMTADNLYVDKR